MTQEQLVPTLETCQQLKECGYPQHSHYGWVQSPHHTGLYSSVFAEWQDWSELVKKFTEDEQTKIKIYAAPTLHELLEQCSLSVDVIKVCRHTSKEAKAKYSVATGYTPINFIADDNPAEAVSLLWLKQKKL